MRSARKRWTSTAARAPNPAGGCLPMFIQIPVLSALYGIFSHAFEIRGAEFLWIRDLSQPDMLVQSLGFWPHRLNLLPILYLGLQLLQMKIAPQQPKSDDPQAEMNRKMMSFMPIMLTFMFYAMPAGLMLTSRFSAISAFWKAGTSASTSSRTAARAPNPRRHPTARRRRLLIKPGSHSSRPLQPRQQTQRFIFQRAPRNFGALFTLPPAAALQGTPARPRNGARVPSPSRAQSRWPMQAECPCANPRAAANGPTDLSDEIQMRLGLKRLFSAEYRVHRGRERIDVRAWIDGGLARQFRRHVR